MIPVRDYLDSSTYIFQTVTISLTNCLTVFIELKTERGAHTLVAFGDKKQSKRVSKDDAVSSWMGDRWWHDVMSATYGEGHPPSSGRYGLVMIFRIYRRLEN